MTLDLFLTGLVVAVACFYIIRKLVRPSSGCGGCNCSQRAPDAEIKDLRKKDTQE